MGDVKIGLEIHGYIDVPSNVKLFCNCSLAPADPNTNICPVCTGQPGSKPMLPNKEAVDAIIKIALFLECSINPSLLWQRKHYSWPDLPNGYQKTMSGAYSQPVGLNGKFLGIGIEEIHLEEDPARWDPMSGGVDYNRSGTPLVEIVTKPDFTSSSEVREWVQNLMIALQYIKAVKPELGIKCDVNVSIAPKFIRTEVKNVNSFTGISQAIDFEINRQKNEPIKMQTRAWEESSGTTVFMRDKESAQDYMFIPEPDLPLIHITDEYTEEIKDILPERPDQKQATFESLGIAKDVSQKLSSDLYLANTAENDMATLRDSVAPDFIANRFVNEIKGELITANKTTENLANTNVEMRQLLIKAFHDRTLTNIAFKELLHDLFAGDNKMIQDTVASREKNKLGSAQLEEFVKDAIKARPEAAEDARSGKEKAINAIVGLVMAKTKGTADPAVVQELVRKLL